jgi:hypothetical protein
LIKFRECLIYNTTLDLTAVVNDLAAEGTQAAREDLATVSPYLTSKTHRFGQWALDLTPPPAMVGRLNLPESTSDKTDYRK